MIIYNEYQLIVMITECLDWSERRYHLAGAPGAALMQQMLNNDWIRRKKNSREIILTAKGSAALYDTLKLRLG